MAVVGRLLPHCNFNGKVNLERVSKTRYISRCTVYHDFSCDTIVNSEVNRGTWKKLVTDVDVRIEYLNELISLACNLEEDIINRLEFTIAQILKTQATQSKF